MRQKGINSGVAETNACNFLLVFFYVDLKHDHQKLSFDNILMPSSLLLMIDSSIWISEDLSLFMKSICASFRFIFRKPLNIYMYIYIIYYICI